MPYNNGWVSLENQSTMVLCAYKYPSVTNNGAKEVRKVELPFKKSRKASGYTAEAAASLLHIDKRSLYRIEAGQQPALPEMVWNMAGLYRDSDLFRWYQSEACPIGRKVSPPVLNGTVNSPQAVHCKLAEELEEAALSATEFGRLVLNKMTANDFSDPETRHYFTLYGICVSDVKQAIAEVEGCLIRMFGLEALELAARAHREKMLQKGYLRTKEKAPLRGTEKISYDSLPLSEPRVKESSCYYH